MAEANPGPKAPAPVQTLHLALHRQGQAWTAELAAQPGAAGLPAAPARRFSSLRELVGYLSRLEQPLGSKGLR